MHIRQVAKTALLCMGLALCLAVAAPATHAQEFSPETKPLVLIRFNQPHVYYDRQLYMAISRAVEVKPGVMFDLVSFVPTVADPERSKQWRALAAAHVKKVVASLGQMGVPASRITYSAQSQAGLRYDEIHLFAR